VVADPVAPSRRPASTTGTAAPRMTATPATKCGAERRGSTGNGRMVSTTRTTGRAHRRSPVHFYQQLMAGMRDAIAEGTFDAWRADFADRLTSPGD
jgi:hypothetical protein